MKNKTIIWIFPIFTIGLLLMLIQNCEKDDDENPTNGMTNAVFNPDVIYGSVKDQDGNEYKTINIGSQTWMAENLRTTKYRNGDKIPEVADKDKWLNLNSGAYINYDDTKSLDSIATYGRLYNWAAVIDARNIAPHGWHVPTYNEWKILETFLGDSIAGNQLKESGTLHWKAPNKGATNETGFTALGCGYLYKYAGVFDFHHRRIEGGWWTASEDSSNTCCAFHFTMGYNYPMLGGCWCTKHDGYSIRCVKD
jgi:uncharacterized protein (TIGR02145 family)